MQCSLTIAFNLKFDLVLLSLHAQYIPMKGDRVLGVVTKTTGRSYRVDIGSATQASLPELAFEGATKRNKPNLQVSLSLSLSLSLSPHTDLHT